MSRYRCGVNERIPDEYGVDRSSADGAKGRALAGLTRAIYLLDRGFTEPRKVAAFTRAREAVTELSPSEVESRFENSTFTDLAGIGPSTSQVIREAIEGTDDGYLARLEQTTRVNPGIGADLRAHLRGDLHMHSTWSDGGASILEMATVAANLGHEYIVVTDHSPRLTVAHGLSPERLAAQTIEIAAVDAAFDGLRILSGVEVDILLDGTLDLPDEILAQRDLVVASVHSKLSMDADEMTHRLIPAVRSPHVDVLGHMTGRKITGRGRAQSSFDATAVFQACVESRTAVEINCRPERMDPPDDLLAQAVAMGCTFAIDSDAHSPGQLEWVAIGCDRAAKAGIGPERIINCRRGHPLGDATV